MRWAGHSVRKGKKRNAYRILLGKLEGKRAHMWVDNIKMVLG
jgi:hypothetical protein